MEEAQKFYDSLNDEEKGDLKYLEKELNDIIISLMKKVIELTNQKLDEGGVLREWDFLECINGAIEYPACWEHCKYANSECQCNSCDSGIFR